MFTTLLSQQSSSGDQTLAPGLFANVSTLFAAAVTAGVVALSPPLLANSNTFFAATATVSGVTLATSRLNNNNSFLTSTVTAGAVSLTQSSVFTDVDAFYSIAVSPGLVANRFNNSSVFFSPTVQVAATALIASRVNNNNSFFGSFVSTGSVGLTVARFNNSNVYYSGSVIPGVVGLTVPRLNNSNVVFSSSVSTLTPLIAARVNNSNGFYSFNAIPGVVALSANRVNNTNAFYTLTAVPITPLFATRFQNSSVFFNSILSGGDRVLVVARYNNLPDGFYGQILIRGTVNVDVPYVLNTGSVFYPAETTVETRLQVEDVLLQTNTIYELEVLPPIGDLNLSRLNNSSTFFDSTVAPGEVVLEPGVVSNTSSFRVHNVYGDGQPQALTVPRINNVNQIRWFTLTTDEENPCVHGACGIGGWTGPLPGDPDNNVALSATPAFGGIDVNWTYPLTNPEAVAHVLLYRNIAPNIGGMVQIAVVAGNFYYDKLNVGQTYYYWLRIVSVNGTVGELIGPASATARPLIEDFIEELTGSIDRGVLASSLKTELDQISTLNTNLANEIFDRETGMTSFAEALSDVDAGVAQAMTFINNEIASRTSATEALAEAIDLVAVTLGSDIAAVQVNSSAWITPLALANDRITDIGALYTVQLTVNGLVGGFGIYNNGTVVEAGFDVTRFWVGTTQANQRKPFIIENGQTFIDEAVINKLTFTKLRSDDGTFIVQEGKVQANYLSVKGLTVVNNLGVPSFSVDTQGNARFGGELLGATGEFSGTLRAGVVDLSVTQGVTVDHKIPGVYTATVPVGRTSMRVSLVGGGGGGGGGSSRPHFRYNGGGGGGGGYVVQTYHGLTPGTVMTITVGAGGTPGGARDGIFTSGAPGGSGAQTQVTWPLYSPTANGGGGGIQARDLPTGGVSGGVSGEAGESALFNVEDGNGETLFLNYNGGKGGNSRFGTGGAGGIGLTDSAGQMGSGWGAGGGGGGTMINFNAAGFNPAPGTSGRAVVEFFDPNGVVLRDDWNTLITALQGQGIATS